jgi:nucleoside-diphosphate-sugar epimerase
MKIGIIGGNSQVATEVAFHLREWGHEVLPIVRNPLAAAFVERHGFECTTADPTDGTEIGEALSDVDAAVLAAHAPPYSGEIDDPRVARATNEAMIDCAVDSTPADVPFVYFSTVSAYGSDLYTEGSSWRLYAREKRHLERYTLDACETASKSGYPLRLGLVVGANQNRTHRMRRKLADDANQEEKGVVRVPVTAGESANVVHAATVAEAVERCAVGRPKSQTYTALNEPQWSWRETLEWHTPAGTRLVFEGSTAEGDASFVDGTLSLAASAVKRYKNHLIPYQVYVPTWLNREVIHFFRKRNVAGDVGGYESRTALSLREFSNRPLAKGTQVPDLTATDALLAAQPSFDDVFGPTRVDGPR